MTRGPPVLTLQTGHVIPGATWVTQLIFKSFRYEPGSASRLWGGYLPKRQTDNPLLVCYGGIENLKSLVE